MKKVTTIAAIGLALLIMPMASPGKPGAPDTLSVQAEEGQAGIETAMARADSGDVILLGDGTYMVQELKISKPLTIAARNKGNAILDGSQGGHVIEVESDYVTVRGLKVTGSKVSYVEDNAAIQLEKVSHVLVEENILRDNFFGIYLAKSDNCTVRNNEIATEATREAASGNGIHLWYCRDITVEGNHVDGHRDGIYFEFVEDSEIRNNLSENCLRYGLHFMFSDYCHYSHNVFRYNSAGVAVMFTRNVEMVHNKFYHNWGAASYGLLLKEIYDSTIANNLFEQNTTGIYTEASNRITIRKNNFVNNGWAVKLMANSMDNTYEKNNFSGNAFDVATNSRQHFNTFKNNYWGNYEGYDLNNDGTGDVPYRPVRLFSVLVEKQPTSLALLHSPFVDMLDLAERILPVLTPKALTDEQPKMTPYDLEIKL